LDREALSVLADLPGVPELLTPPVTTSEPPFNLDVTALTKPVPTEPMLCLDFGTAKSKAFATNDGNLIPLPIGQLDDDVDGSVFAVASSVWIDESGLVFVGSEAIRHGERRATDVRRQRLDSLKQFVSQSESLELLTFTALGAAANPTSLAVTMDDAVTLYLGYLTDLASTAMSEAGLSRYAKRTFSLPCWKEGHRAWAAPYLAKLIGRAQLVADTFKGRWRDGIPVDQWLAAVAQAKRHDDESLRWLVRDEERPIHQMRRWGAVLEPLAAGSASILRPVGRELVLVVDVGAGTSDFSLFLVSQGQPQAPGHRAIPVTPVADAVRFAGDSVDEILLKELLRAGNMDPDSALAAHAKASVRLSGLRRLKERLFVEGRVEVILTSDATVSIERDEFVKTAGVRDFERQLHSHIRAFLEKVHPSFAPLFKSIALVLTGGGRDLPMVASLASQSWQIHGSSVAFRLMPRVPVEFGRYGEAFGREYPQLAVAIGGATRHVLDEREALNDWAGGITAPGPLSRFPTKGM
jgi:molecular chaperone HscA